ncbi:MAG: ubiquinone biosynthesis accessory factor UbiJ [Endozoicomonas sp.]
MVDPVITTGLLAAIERQVNAILALDPVTVKKLKHQFGKVVAFRCLSPQWACFVHFMQDGVRLASVFEGDVDVTFEGSGIAFAVLASRQALMFSEVQGLTVSGDEALIAELHVLHQQVDIDWERPLCKTFGDIPGHLMAQGIRFMGNHIQRGQRMIQNNLGEYLQEEVGVIPSRIEVEGFIAEVEALATSVTILEKQLLPLMRSSLSVKTGGNESGGYH